MALPSAYGPVRRGVRELGGGSCRRRENTLIGKSPLSACIASGRRGFDRQLHPFRSSAAHLQGIRAFGHRYRELTRAGASEGDSDAHLNVNVSMSEEIANQEEKGGQQQHAVEREESIWEVGELPVGEGKKGKVAKGKFTRVISGLAMGALGALATFSGGAIFAVFLTLAVAQISREYNAILATQDLPDRHCVPSIVRQIMPLCNIFMMINSATGLVTTDALFVLFAFVCISVLLTQEEVYPRAEHVTDIVFGLFFCGFLPTFWIKLRAIAAYAAGSLVSISWPTAWGGAQHITVGWAATVLVACSIVASDVGAYYGGKNFGKTQMNPVSPNKTVEGAACGFFAAMGASGILGAVFSWPRPLVLSVPIAMMVSAAGIVGDLVESLMKREAGVKDAGMILPGHGGLLDRFDSWMLSGPLAYFLVKFVL